MRNINFKKPLTVENLKLYKYIVYLANNAANQYNTFDDYFYCGLEALLKAEKTYKENKNTTFVTYARKVIFNEMATLVTKNKNENIHYYDSEEEFAQTSYKYDPTNSYDAKILLSNLESIFTKREKLVLKHLLSGYVINEIASLTKLTYKTVDNTMQSIKRKIRK